MENYKLLGLSPLLETPDVESTLKFYTEILGFIIENYSKEYQWALLKRDDITIMISAPNTERNMPAPIMSGSIYIRTENVDSAWEQLKDRCNIYYPIENFHYGMREFGLFDNNGYLLQFGQVIAAGVNL
jgi:uncharacterized glyoxalase superfamily protein PhnB